MSKFERNLVGFSDLERQGIVSGSLLIHRIFSFDRFIDVIRNSKLALVKPKLWDDPYENPFHRSITARKESMSLTLQELGSNIFCQCWSTKAESDAMWRIYSPDRRGVMVHAKVLPLFESMKSEFGQFEDVYLGKVNYLTRESLKRLFESEDFIRNNLRVKSRSPESIATLLYKRDSFDHESEVRLILSRYISEIPGDITDLTIDIDSSIAGVTLDPRLSKEDFDRTSFLVGIAGYKGVVEQSALYSAPDLNLSIPSVSWIHGEDTGA